MGHIHGNVDELHKVANETHDCESNGDRLADLKELCDLIVRHGFSVHIYERPFCDGFVQRVRN